MKKLLQAKALILALGLFQLPAIAQTQMQADRTNGQFATEEMQRHIHSIPESFLKHAPLQVLCVLSLSTNALQPFWYAIRSVSRWN